MNPAGTAMTLAAIGAGAVLGAWARWGLALWLNRAGQPMPWGTLAANVAGGLFIGAALAIVERRPELAAWRPFLVTGVLGALTTFSSFSAESLLMLQRGAFGHAFAHSVVHLGGSLAATALGWRLLR